MFGKNEIVGKKYFDNAGDKVFVTSVFMTLQGEGPYRGEPAVFVRFAKCNLNCSFCDTWFDSGDWLTFEELDAKIFNAIKSAYNDKVPTWLFDPGRNEMQYGCGLVITGGEPMLQKNINELLYRYESVFAWTQIESNGTSHQLLPYSTTLVISPKCSEKNGKPVKYLEPNKDVLARANCLKFVMNADPASPYSSIPEWALAWRKQTGKPIFVSPMNIYNKEPERNKSQKLSANDRSLEQRSVEDEVISFWSEGLLNMEQNKINHEYAARYCLEHGCILNLQLHLYASLA
jgi:organic radical activating enzyme